MLLVYSSDDEYSSCRLGSARALVCVFFFFNDTATTEIYTLSLHDALPICHPGGQVRRRDRSRAGQSHHPRSEEHTAELQSLRHLVCRLLLEKKNVGCADLWRGFLFCLVFLLRCIISVG